MPLSAERRTLLEQTLPPAESTRERMRHYMAVLDLTPKQFAPHFGYGYSAIRSFLNDTYVTDSIGSSDVLIREAVEKYMDRHPLSAGGDRSGRLYETENVRQLRYWFDLCLEQRAMAVIYGPPGSQKTFVMEHLVAEYNRRELARQVQRDRTYMVRSSINIQPRDLLARVCAELGVPVGSTLQRCFSSIRMAVRERRVLLIFDEAQLLGIPALEALRELHDVDHIGLMLLGSHRLRQLFDSRAAELEQFNSRIEDLVELVGVSEDSARAILSLELPDLDADTLRAAIKGCYVPDAYSRKPNAQYLSMRRLFKFIAQFRAQLAEQAEAAAKETIQ